MISGKLKEKDILSYVETLQLTIAIKREENINKKLLLQFCFIQV